MVSDQEIAEGVETLLQQSDPNSMTSLNGVVQQLEAKLGLDLSHKAGFIRDQISLLLRSPSTPQQVLTTTTEQQVLTTTDQSLDGAPPAQPPPPHLQPHSNVSKAEAFRQIPAEVPKKRAQKSRPVGSKRKRIGGANGLFKACGVSPALQGIVGEPTMSRTEIVKQLWAYIKKNNLQDPSNKSKIICDDALRVVFETDCTDMLNMHKLLAKHIINLEPTKKSSERFKPDAESTTESTESGPPPIIISEKLATFLGTGGREMLQAEATKRVWEYIKVNKLEDPVNSMAILCDAKLRELLGCESISAFGIQEMLLHNHFSDSHDV